MLTRGLCVAILLAGCATTPAPSKRPLIETLQDQPRTLRLLLDREDAFRLSRAGIMDPSSPSGLTDRFRHRAAIGGYVEGVVRANGLCAQGFEILDVSPAPKPFDTAITLACLAS